MSAHDSLLELAKPLALKYGTNVCIECTVATSAPDEARWRVWFQGDERDSVQTGSLDDAVDRASTGRTTAADRAASLRAQVDQLIAEAQRLEAGVAELNAAPTDAPAESPPSV